MSKSVQEIARRLAELRALTQRQVAEARADQRRYEEAAEVFVAMAVKYGKAVSKPAKLGPNDFALEVMHRAEQSARALGEKALEPVFGTLEAATEMAIDTLNRDFLEAERELTDEAPPEISEDRPTPAEVVAAIRSGSAIDDANERIARLEEQLRYFTEKVGEARQQDVEKANSPQTPAESGNPDFPGSD